MTDKPDMGGLLTTREVGARLRVHPETVLRYGDQGFLPFQQLGRRKLRRYRPEDVDALLIPAATTEQSA